MNDRQIRRLAYDGNYQRAIEMLLDLVEQQQNKIEELNSEVNTLKNSFS